MSGKKIKKNANLLDTTDQKLADKIIDAGVQPIGFTNKEGKDRKWTFVKKEVAAVGVSIK